MTLEISTNPRFADHGDIGACDTTSLMMSDLPDGDPAPPHSRVSPPAKNEASDPVDQGPPPAPDGSSSVTTTERPGRVVVGRIVSTAPSQTSAVGHAPPPPPPPPPTQSGAVPPHGSHTFQTVIISWPSCLASPSCPEDACTSAFCQEGHTNAISDSASKGEAAVGGATRLHPLLSDGAPPPPPSPSNPLMRNDAVNITKTVNQQHKTCDIPPSSPKANAAAVATAVLVVRVDDKGQKPGSITDISPSSARNNSSSEESFKQPGTAAAAVPTYQPLAADSGTAAAAAPRMAAANPPAHSCSAAAPPAADVAKTASLSIEEKKQMIKKAFVRPPPPLVTGWSLPPGGGLRGGGGETTAISNGTTGWGPPPPPPSNNPGNSTGGGWGAAPPPVNQGAVSAWGTPPSAPNNNNNNNNNSAAAAASSVAASSSAASVTSANNEDNSGPKQPLPQQQQQQLLNNGMKASPPGMAAPAGGGQPAGSTSWAAAAGKGLPPSEPSTGQMNGATNKQLEQLNSVREALFSQDGWGGQHVKQDTSWDVGGALSEPATPLLAPKADSMQWQAPTTARNDGTDLWKSTLSGVPQAPKPQAATPWGNHTPAHPADYKTWGEPDEDPSGSGGDMGGGRGDMGGGRGMEMGRGADMGGRGMPPAPSGPSWGGGMDDQQAPAWDGDRGPVKPKEDSWNPNPGNGGGQWSGGGGGRPQDGGGGWGAPPPVKPVGGWSNQPVGRDQPWHHSESPTIGRRFDDGGWKDMPMPNMGSRVGPPGPPSRLPPGALKPNNNDPSPWGAPHAPGRGWGDLEPMGGASSAWMEDGGNKPSNMGGGWGGGDGGSGWPAPRKPMRSSPSWEDPGMGPGDPGRGGWGNGGRTGGGGGMLPPTISKEGIWGSKQFRILCEMGFRKEDVETALRNTNLQLDDALEMLNAVSRASAMPGRGGGMGNMPLGGNDMVGFPVGPRGGGGGLDPGYDMRFPGSGGMPYPPGGDGLPLGSNPSLQNNPSRAGGLNPALVQQMSMGGGGAGGPLHPGSGGGPAPPRPAQSGGGGVGGGGPPSTSQLRLLVQQIQMAVQAGHLNAQILNQPLAPQTLLLLNQLLQQIKALQQCQQQHGMALQAAAGARGGNNASSSQALLHINVQITKHKQQIGNLQNQITAQQAQYLKNQQLQPPMGAGGMPGAGGGVVPDSSDLSLSLGNLTMTGDHSQQQQQQQGGVGGSKLTKWIKSGGDTNAGQQQDPDFSRAPGSSKSSNSQQPSPNILLDPSGPWSNGNNGAAATSGGWPDSNNANEKNSNNSGGGGVGADSEPDFGIPEFVPGKAWKGTTIKDPSEDPTLTPGSVATTPILLHQQQQGEKPSVSHSSSIAATTMMENSLGLTSSTWSFGSSATKEPAMQLKDGWGMPPVSRETNLTPMGQDLWGLSRPVNKQPTPTMSGGGGGGGGWPAPTNGWSNGTNAPGGGGVGPLNNGSAWLLLRNLTAQIDGSTLRTLCMQHGPLNNFHLYLTHGIALAKYSNGSEAKKAQSALNNCVLGNTTILAEVAGEPAVEDIVRTLSQAGGSGAGAQQGRSGPVQPSSSYAAYSAALGKASMGASDTWGSLGGGNPWPSTGLGGSVWGAPDDQHNRTTPLNSFLPPDLLSETM